MKRKSTLFLLLTTILLIAFLVPACQKKYELDDEALLQLQCNASDAESIFDGIGETSETTVKPTETEPTDPSETEATEATEKTKATEATEATATETTKETTKKTSAPTADPSAYVTPVVKAVAGTNSVKVSWNKITNADLKGYKVVASVSDSTPQYTENGYYTWITDANTTSCTIENGAGYNGGDVGVFSGGTAYYFSVTAVYGKDWDKVAGNAVKVTMPGDPASTEPEGSHPASILNTPSVAGDSASFSWSKSDDTTGFQYYKLVGSQTKENPTYPADGYLAVISDPNSTGRTVTLGAGTWYIGITTVYKENGKTYYAYSNYQTITITAPSEPAASE